MIYTVAKFSHCSNEHPSLICHISEGANFDDAIAAVMKVHEILGNSVEVGARGSGAVQILWAGDSSSMSGFVAGLVEIFCTDFLDRLKN